MSPIEFLQPGSIPIRIHPNHVCRVHSLPDGAQIVLQDGHPVKLVTPFDQCREAIWPGGRGATSFPASGGQTVTLDPSKVCRLRPVEGGTEIVQTDGHAFTVSEPFTAISFGQHEESRRPSHSAPPKPSAAPASAPSSQSSPPSEIKT